MIINFNYSNNLKSRKAVTGKGILLAGGSGTRLFPMTHAVNKQLIPVYDKPMIYYPLTILMMAGIRKILIVTNQTYIANFKSLLGSGSQWGISLEYAIQESPNGLSEAFLIGEKFICDDPVCLILGDNIFHGNSLEPMIRSAAEQGQGSTIFGILSENPSHFGVIDIDSDGNIISLEEKPKNPKSNYIIPGIYFFDGRVSHFAKTLSPSNRGELEIIDLIQIYLNQNCLKVSIFDREIKWMDTGTPDLLVDAGRFVQATEKQQGVKIGCPEELAFRRGFIDRSILEDSVRKYFGTSYGNYLSTL
jgi:glucose-1-phosphate thymidylyltransferase